MGNNDWRKATCPSKKVDDTNDDKYWLPPLEVFDAIAMVDHLLGIQNPK